MANPRPPSLRRTGPHAVDQEHDRSVETPLQANAAVVVKTDLAAGVLVDGNMEIRTALDRVCIAWPY
jgi:hypothetical protein